MSLKQYFFIMIFATLLSWTAWFFVLLNIDPYQSSAIGFLFFYVSLFFSLLGTFSIILFTLYRKFSRKPLPLFIYVQKSFLSSIIFSMLLVGMLYLYAINLLTLWNLILFIIIVGLAFSFILSLKQSNANV